MKTKELIERLQEADPSGELPVCNDNYDILFIDVVAAYYDGRLEQLIRDPESKYYGVTGARVLCSGDKVRIHTHSIEDAIWENQDLLIDLSDIKKRMPSCLDSWAESIEQWRNEAREK